MEWDHGRVALRQLHDPTSNVGDRTRREAWKVVVCGEATRPIAEEIPASVRVETTSQCEGLGEIWRVGGRP